MNFTGSGVGEILCEQLIAIDCFFGFFAKIQKNIISWLSILREIANLLEGVFYNQLIMKKNNEPK